MGVNTLIGSGDGGFMALFNLILGLGLMAVAGAVFIGIVGGLIAAYEKITGKKIERSFHG